MKQTLDDKALDALLATYRLKIDMGEPAVDAMALGARIKAVQLKQGIETHGLFGLVAEIFGLGRASAAMWSACAGMVVAAVIGISVGASDSLPIMTETAFSIDFDSVMGSGTLAAPQQIEQD